VGEERRGEETEIGMKHTSEPDNVLVMLGGFLESEWSSMYGDEGRDLAFPLLDPSFSR